MNQQDERYWTRIVLCAIGLCQGALINVLATDWWHGLFGPTERASVLIFVLSAPALGLLLIQRASWRKDTLFSAIAGLFAALLFITAVVSIGFNTPQPDGSQSPNDGMGAFFLAFGMSTFLLLAISLPFYQAWRAEGRFVVPYRSLFLNAWSNKLYVLVAGLFLGTSWLVLALWGGLFNLVGVAFFADLFSRPWFALVFSGAVGGLGIALARERQATILALLKLVLTLFQVLAPILAFIILLFLTALPFTGLEALWDTQIASRLLLAALVILIIFENAVIQTADADNVFWRPASWVIMTANVAMPVLAVLAGWAIYLRVGQYGWTPARFYMAVVSAVGLIYALAYAGSVVVKRGSWAAGVTRLNPLLALGTLVVAVFVNLPPLEPYSLSARDQLARLRDGRLAAEHFDFAFLRFELGQPGRDALIEIENDETLMMNSSIADGLAFARAFESLSEIRRAEYERQIATADMKDITTYMDVFPPKFEPPHSAVTELLNGSMVDLQSCRTFARSENFRCAILGVDLNGDGLQDIALLSQRIPNLVVLLGKQTGAWQAGQVLLLGDHPRDPDFPNQLSEAIKSGDVQLVPHEVQDVVIGGMRFK